MKERKRPSFGRGRDFKVTVIHYCELSKDTAIADPNTKFSNTKNDDVTFIEFQNIKLIEYLPVDIYETFPNLAVFRGDRCAIKSVSYQNFRGLNNLSQLSLNGNDLETLEENIFDDLTSLSFLYLDSNKISSLAPKLFSKNSNLDFLHMNHNLLTKLHADSFHNNEKLALLHISDNKIQFLEPGVFDSLTLMRQVWLRNNQISELSGDLFDHCISLIDIDLSGNKIATIPPSLLSNLVNLNDIAFARNPLTVVDFAIFDHNPELHKIYLNGIGDIVIKNIERVDKLKGLQDIVLVDNNCINASYHEGLLEELKKDVNANCSSNV